MRTCIHVVILVALLCSARAARAQASVDSVDAVDLTPPATAGQVDRVAVKLPAIDALAQIEVTEESVTSGKRYTFTNKGAEPVEMWTWAMRRAGDGTIFPNPSEQSTLDPGKTKKMTIAYRSDKHGPYGEYRLIYCATLRAKYFANVPNQELTAEGKTVQAFVLKLGKKIEDERDRYKGK